MLYGSEKRRRYTCLLHYKSFNVVEKRGEKLRTSVFKWFIASGGATTKLKLISALKSEY